jgi:hypothetical protein
MTGTQAQQISKNVIVEKTKRQPMSRPVTKGTVRQAADYNLPDRGPLADATATINPGSESALADNSRELDADACTKNANAEIEFPRCDAAIRTKEGGEWDLAYAILDECSETGADGLQNGSYAKMKAMRDEIAKNHGVDLSFERIRKLRKVASAFPPGRGRPGVSLEAHLEAGTPEALEAFINSAPAGTALTRDYIRQQKCPREEAEQDQQKAERRRQVEDQRTALQNLCRQLERETEEREQRYADLCRSVGKEPEPFSPPLATEDEPSRTVAEDLEQGLRVLVMARGFDPNADNVKRAIEEFVRAVAAQQE